MNRKVLLIVILVVLAIAAALVRKSTRPPAPAVDLMMQGVADAATAEVATLLPNGGKIVVIAPADVETDPMPRQIRQAFLATVKRAKGIDVVATELVALPGEESGQAPMAAPLPADVYERVLQAHRNADAIVSLLGPPALGNRPAPAQRPKLLTVSMMVAPRNLQELLDQRVVDAAIVPRETPAGSAMDAKTAQQWFNRDYTILRAGGSAG
jgi:hypothetical protein